MRTGHVTHNSNFVSDEFGRAMRLPDVDLRTIFVDGGPTVQNGRARVGISMEINKASEALPCLENDSKIRQGLHCHINLDTMC